MVHFDVDTAISVFMIVCGIAAFTRLMLGGPAGYGRYSRQSSWAYVNAKSAWMTQEMWSAVLPMVAVAETLREGNTLNPVQILLLGMFLAHYFWRSFGYSLLLRGGKPTPAHIWLLACTFCILNGFLQADSILKETPDKSGGRISLRHVVGFAIWLVGWVINLHSDNVLRNLRAPGETGYRIPRGGAFEWVSGANYFGEALEWIGYALAAWTLPATAFAIFTFGNIGPRAWHHHQWYKRRFQSYPSNRRAIIPYIW